MGRDGPGAVRGGAIMAEGKQSPRMPAPGRRGGLDTTAGDAFELWLKGASYAEIDGLLCLVADEVKARGHELTWCVSWTLGGVPR